MTELEDNIGKSLREQVEVVIENSRPPGGQQVGPDPGVIVVTHKETGISVRLPPVNSRSQHKRVIAALDAIKYLLEAA